MARIACRSTMACISFGNDASADAAFNRARSSPGPLVAGCASPRLADREATCHTFGVSQAKDEPPEWERLLAAERHLQELVPGTVLVGGTAAAVHVGHRFSQDGDHVLVDLRDRFDEVLAELEAAAGWTTARTRRPILILGQLEGVLTGIRQLRRTQPLDVEMIDGLRVPTLAEMARIKSWLLATRDTIRDYLDTVVLFERLGVEATRGALRSFDRIYAQPNAASPLAEVAERLAAAAPADRASIDLASYRGLRPPWNDWSHVSERGRTWAPVVAAVAMQDDP
jgi:hypothetical protein